MRGQSEGLTELEAYIQAVGLASTCAGGMLIDAEDPIGMMQQVCKKFQELEAENTQLRAELADKRGSKHIVVPLEGD